jgi:nucleoside-diphosphate-sugar epimerase
MNVCSQIVTNMKETILLTGAGGYLGKNLAPVLRNDYNLREHFRMISTLNANNSNPTFGDLHQIKILESIVKNVDCVLHAAALIPTTKRDVSLKEFIDSNLGITANLARAAIDANVSRFVYVSTVNLYDFRVTNADETCSTGNFALHPEYLQSKLEAENALFDLFANRKDDLLILRIGTPFGGIEPVKKLIPHMINRALLNQDLLLTTSGSTFLNYIYMPDLIHSISFLLRTRQSGIFNLTTSFRLENLLETIISKSESSSKVLDLTPSSNQQVASFTNISCKKYQQLAIHEFTSMPQAISEYIQKMRTS